MGAIKSQFIILRGFYSDNRATISIRPSRKFNKSIMDRLVHFFFNDFSDEVHENSLVSVEYAIVFNK